MLTAMEVRYSMKKHVKKHPTLEQDSATLEKLIIQAAKAGKTSIRVPDEMCEFKGYSAKFIAEGLYELLIEKGYVVDTMAEDRRFVGIDVWIEVSW